MANDATASTTATKEKNDRYAKAKEAVLKMAADTQDGFNAKGFRQKVKPVLLGEFGYGEKSWPTIYQNIRNLWKAGQAPATTTDATQTV